jgi:two-component system, LytTR family, sensor kinase
MSVFSGKKSTIVLHIVAWTILLLIPLYLITANPNMNLYFIQRVYLRTIVYVIIFYLNFFWLISWLLFRGKKWQYYLVLITLIIGFYFLNEAINRNVFVKEEKKTIEVFNKMSKELKMPPRHWNFDIYNYLFTCSLITAFSIGLRMNLRYHENEKKRKELEKEKLSSELAFLKNQVSPHFFFNTLNNIYSLTEINTKEAQNAILQLSKLMRYLLYESEKGDTKLSSEIAFMQNYIELMKLRISDKVSLNISFPSEYKDINFPPLLFISFIENAFKHGISYREPSYIQIELNQNGNEVHFKCSNSMAGKVERTDDSGIGLDNIKKRLTLLFQDNYRLSINQTDKSFEVDLYITISELK